MHAPSQPATDDAGHRLSRPTRLTIAAAVAVAVTAVIWLIGPIRQWQSYHRFADTRSCCGVANTADVLSNLPFLFIGLYALTRLRDVVVTAPWERIAWIVLFVGTVLTAFGSGWYHLAPDDNRLAWDRYPMTLVFTSMTSLLVGERVSNRLGRALLWPLVVVGVASVEIWRRGTLVGGGDLRLYATLHYVPLLVLPLLLWFFRARTTISRYQLWAALWYGVAKLLEWQDRNVYEALGFVSGHTLKHLAGAACCWMLCAYAWRREIIDPAAGPTRLDG